MPAAIKNPKNKHNTIQRVLRIFLNNIVNKPKISPSFYDCTYLTEKQNNIILLLPFLLQTVLKVFRFR